MDETALLIYFFYFAPPSLVFSCNHNGKGMIHPEAFFLGGIVLHACIVCY